MGAPIIKRKFFSAISPEDYEGVERRAANAARREFGRNNVSATTVVEREATGLDWLFGAGPTITPVDDFEAVNPKDWTKGTVRTVVRDKQGRELGQVERAADTAKRAEGFVADKAALRAQEQERMQAKAPEREPEYRYEPEPEIEAPEIALEAPEVSPVFVHAAPSYAAMFEPENASARSELRAFIPAYFNAQAANDEPSSVKGGHTGGGQLQSVPWAANMEGIATAPHLRIQFIDAREADLKAVMKRLAENELTQRAVVPMGEIPMAQTPSVAA